MNIDTIKNIKIENFDYPLPDERIARHPLECRDACKLILSDKYGNVSHHHFNELPDLINDYASNPLIICNETRVINARMVFHKSTGSRIEIFLLEPAAPADYNLSFASRHSCVWRCLIGNLKKWKEGPLQKKLTVSDYGEVILSARFSTGITDMDQAEGDNSKLIEFSWSPVDAGNQNSPSFASIVELAGNIPIPPYLKRESEESDLRDYQTVYSRVEGSVAAPTAGLHFTEELFDRLKSAGAHIDKVTLHVGAGTFRPVKSENIGDHPMHTEKIDVSLSVIEDIIQALETERPIIAVGTTSVRTIESLPLLGLIVSSGESIEKEGPVAEDLSVEQWEAYDEEVRNFPTIDLLKGLRDYLLSHGEDHISASTRIMIAPGFKWRIVSGMITNFHQPQSTLLLLVSSFLERDVLMSDDLKQWKRVYDEALAADYRFLSYGDACLLFPKMLI